MTGFAKIAIAAAAALGVALTSQAVGLPDAWASPGPRAERSRPGARTPARPPRPVARPAAPSRNQTPAPAKAKADAGADRRRKLKQMIFELGDEVEGGAAGPTHDTVTARGELIHSSLIRVRTDFLPEIHASVDSL